MVKGTFVFLRNLKVWDATIEGKCLPNKWGYQGFFQDSRWNMASTILSSDSDQLSGVCTADCIENGQASDDNCGLYANACILSGKKTPAWGWYNVQDCDGVCFNNLAGSELWPLQHNSGDDIVQHRGPDDNEIPAEANYLQYCRSNQCYNGDVDLVTNPNELIPTKLYSGIAHEPFVGTHKIYQSFDSCTLISECFDYYEEFTCDCPDGWGSGDCQWFTSGNNSYAPVVENWFPISNPGCVRDGDISNRIVWKEECVWDTYESEESGTVRSQLDGQLFNMIRTDVEVSGMGKVLHWCGGNDLFFYAIGETDLAGPCSYNGEVCNDGTICKPLTGLTDLSGFGVNDENDYLPIPSVFCGINVNMKSPIEERDFSTTVQPPVKSTTLENPTWTRLMGISGLCPGEGGMPEGCANPSTNGEELFDNATIPVEFQTTGWYDGEDFGFAEDDYEYFSIGKLRPGHWNFCRDLYTDTLSKDNTRYTTPAVGQDGTQIEICGSGGLYYEQFGNTHPNDLETVHNIKPSGTILNQPDGGTPVGMYDLLGDNQCDFLRYHFLVNPNDYNFFKGFYEDGVTPLPGYQIDSFDIWGCTNNWWSLTTTIHNEYLCSQAGYQGWNAFFPAVDSDIPVDNLQIDNEWATCVQKNGAGSYLPYTWGGSLNLNAAGCGAYSGEFDHEYWENNLWSEGGGSGMPWDVGTYGNPYIAPKHYPSQDFHQPLYGQCYDIGIELGDYYGPTPTVDTYLDWTCSSDFSTPDVQGYIDNSAHGFSGTTECVYSIWNTQKYGNKHSSDRLFLNFATCNQIKLTQEGEFYDGLASDTKTGSSYVKIGRSIYDNFRMFDPNSPDFVDDGDWYMNYNTIWRGIENWDCVASPAFSDYDPYDNSVIAHDGFSCTIGGTCTNNCLVPVGDGATGNCVYDCACHCVDEAFVGNWIGDGYCDCMGDSCPDGETGYGIDFNCDEYEFDGGDCEGFSTIMSLEPKYPSTEIMVVNPVGRTVPNTNLTLGGRKIKI